MLKLLFDVVLTADYLLLQVIASCADLDAYVQSILGVKKGTVIIGTVIIGTVHLFRYNIK